MSSTGENEQDLRKIMDLTRYLAVVLLLLHFYYCCYGAFVGWGLRSEITDRIMGSLGLLRNTVQVKILIVLMLLISLLGTRGKKDEKHSVKHVVIIASVGLLVYFSSGLILGWRASIQVIASAYMIVCSVGFALVIVGAARASRLIFDNLSQDVFNEINETFPQEERLLENEYSINFRGLYCIKNKNRNSWINVINPFRGTLVIGSPGAGKSWFVVLPLIRQMIEKGYAMYIYDFKYDDLSKAAYNWMLQNLDAYKYKPSFYSINFDNLNTSNRCNPLDPDCMNDITDAAESARSILLGLNREWIKKQGDFFVESPINFTTAVIWFLRKYEEGTYCTLPHVIELMQTEYDTLFPVLNSEPEIEALVNPFISAFKNDAMEQLEGQIASAKIGMARLVSPSLYWVMSGNDFTLDINNPQFPKLVCIGNNPEKQNIYGALISLYDTRLTKIVNTKGKIKCGLIKDEMSTMFSNNTDTTIATARSNMVATVLAMQDFSQLRKDYGKDQADVITNICGNIISGQVTGETARHLSERFGKIQQQRDSMNINRNDTSISKSWQLDNAIPASKIATLSSGEFVGIVADNPQEKIKLKMFHAEIVQDTVAINKQMKEFKEIPAVYDITPQEVQDNFFQIKYDVGQIVDKVVTRLKQEREEREKYQT
jgi:hypothetical protein